MESPCSSSLMDCRGGLAWDMQTCVEQVCSCTAVFGHSGPACDTPPPTAPANAIMMALPVALGLVLLLFCGKTLMDVIFIKDVFKFNAAGKTYILAWCGFIMSLATAALSVALAFNRRLYPYVLALDNVAVAFLLAAIISMTSAFVRLATVRVIRPVPMHKRRIIWGIIMVILAFIIVFYVVDYRIYSFACYCALASAGLCGGLFPLVLFIRSVEKNPDIRQPHLFRAAFAEYFMRNGASVQYFGLDPRRSSKITKADTSNMRQSSKVSKNSRDESVEEDSAPGTSPKRAPKERTKSAGGLSKYAPNGSAPSMVRTFSMTSFQMQQPTERALDKALFFLRLIHLGANVSIFMIGFIGFWVGYLMFVTNETANGPVSPDISLAVVFWSLRSCSILGLCFSIIAFTQRLYQKRVQVILEQKALAIKPVVDVPVNEETRLQIAPWLVQADTLAKDLDLKMLKGTSTRRIVQNRTTVTNGNELDDLPDVISTEDDA